MAFFSSIFALEKTLKAIVCRHTRDLAPRVHNLTRLAEIAGLMPDADQKAVLAEVNAFHIEGRYPETLVPPPSKEEALNYIGRAAEVFQWLKNQS